MKITVNKDSSVPIRDQLVEQIGLQIASGVLKGKEKLPSIRALAQRLDIHYSTVTAAYNHLADVGLLEIRQGSGVRVSGRAPGDARPESLSVMFTEFLARFSEMGYSRQDLMQCMKSVSDRKKVTRLVPVDRNRDFHELLISELNPHFSLPVEPRTVEEFLKEKSLMEDSMVVTSLYHLFSFQDAVQDPTRLIACNIEPGRSELDVVDTMPAGSLVLLVSVSPTIMTMATKLLAAKRGEEIAVRSVLVSDTQELHYMLKHVNLIICDSSSEKTVVPLAGKTKVLVFKLYSPSTIALIKDRLEKWG